MRVRRHLVKRYKAIGRQLGYLGIILACALLATACGSSPTAPAPPPPPQPQCTIVHHDAECKPQVTPQGITMVCTQAYDERICK